MGLASKLLPSSLLVPLSSLFEAFQWCFFCPSDARKSYLWSTLGVTASTFNLGALAFWMPTLLTRARLFQGLRCLDGSCLSTDRCSSARLPPQMQTVIKPSLLWPQLRLRSGDHSDGRPGRLRRDSFVALVSGEAAARGSPHLCRRPAGVCPLPLRLHIHSIDERHNGLCESNTSAELKSAASCQACDELMTRARTPLRSDDAVGRLSHPGSDPAHS